MKTCLTTLVIALNLVAVAAQVLAVPDFSGTWQSDPDRAVLLRRVDTTPGRWGDVLKGLRKHQPYAISIIQSSDSIEVTFPGGSGSFLNGEAYKVDGAKATSVRSVGEYWIKVVTQGTWNGEVLTLAATRLVDWWSKAQPSDVARQETQLETVHKLRRQSDGAALVVDTILADEKGRAEYRMVFTRRRP